MRGRKLAQIDALSGPAWPHRRQRRYDARIRISRAQRVGVPTLRAARVEQQIVKVPKYEVVVALGRSPAAVAGIDLEQDAAVQQQREELAPRKIFLPAQPLICCGVDSMAIALASFGSQILNSAPARGDSSTIASARRRR